MKIRSVPKETVFAVLECWANTLRASRPEVRKIGVFGSYARGDYTPASDVDVIVIVSKAATDVRSRALDYPPPPGPVGAEVIVYTEAEVAAMEREQSQWIRRILTEVVWLQGVGPS